MIKLSQMKIFHFFSVLILMLFCSCSDSQKKIVFTQDSEYLQSTIQNKNSNVLWTEEIEKQILTKNISDFDSINKNVNKSIELFNIISTSELVYPFIENFSSLDDSNYSKELYSFIETLIHYIIDFDYESLSKIYSKDYFFNFIFFKNDLDLLFQESFKIENTDNSLAIIDYYIGSPVENSDFQYIPIRFLLKNHFFDLGVYIKKNTDYYVYDIDIITYGEKNAE